MLDLSGLKAKVNAKLADAQSKKAAPRASRGESSEEREMMRREALALGASEGDLALVAGLSDADELSEQAFSGDEEDADTGLQNDVQRLLADMGLPAAAAAAAESSEQEEELDAASAEEEPEEGDAGAESAEEGAESAAESDVESAAEDTARGMVDDLRSVRSDRLLVPADMPWYEVPLDAEAAREHEPLAPEKVELLYERGKEALEADNTLYYEEFTKNSSQRKFMSQILADGTLNDKISSLTLLVQESPVHNVKSLDMLLGYCSKKSRNAALQTLTALQDLFLNGLLPDRKLRYFKNQNLSLMLNKRTLAVFYFEDYLKKTYFKVLEILEKLSHDPIVHVRTQVLTCVFELLTMKPEQEFNLLRLGCNKLGDIDNKVASKASYQLLKLQQAHPNMKAVVVDAVVDMAVKPKADYHTTYYAALTLNQTILRKSETQLANQLVKTYLTLFEKFLSTTDGDNEERGDHSAQTHKSYEARRKKNFKKGKRGGRSVTQDKSEKDVLDEKNAKLFSAILTGLNRAFPFADMPASVYTDHLETLFRITHSCNFNTSVQALVLVHQLVTRTGLPPDRYYRTLYESLLDPRLVHSSKQGLYLNLLYKSLRADPLDARVDAFVKRILQVALGWLNAGAAAGMLYLLQQLCRHAPRVRNLLLNAPRDHEYAGTDAPPRYDPRKRDPAHAHADAASLWELLLFHAHFHPAVAAHAAALADDRDIAKPDLGLHTLAHFLDRFVYRHARARPAARGASIMQPLPGAHAGPLLVRAPAAPALPPNAADWLATRAADVRPDERFFYHYFAGRGAPRRAAPASDAPLDEEDVWAALVRSRPDVEGDSDDGLSPADFADDDSDLPSDADLSDADLSDASDLSADADSSDDDADLDSALLAGAASDDSALVSDAASDLSDSGTTDRKRPRADREGYKKDAANGRPKRQKRRSLRDLPTFAAAEDYAQYLSEPE
ncbi:AaceriAER174Wp [[Ashbya] aceris (nom. inval.)]|nr:AaceriAER174Wp [[Ashbya] aceris (nom. inval.)]